MCIKKMAGVDGVEHGVDVGDRVVLHPLTCSCEVDLGRKWISSRK